MNFETKVWLQPESRRLEFKEKFPGGDQIARTVVAFANGAGGRIVMGVADDPRILVGIDEEELFKIEERISQCIFDQCQPTIIPEIYIQAAEGKSLLVVEVYPGFNKPYYLKKYGKLEGTYVRVGSTNRKASKETLDEMERQRRHISFDGVADYELIIDNLDLTQFIQNYQDATGRILDHQGLKKLGLMIEERGQYHPTHAAILVSDSYERKQRFPYVKIELARFKGNNTSVFLDQLTVEGPIHVTIESCLAFIKRNIALGSTIGEVFRKDFWEYPLTALREALVNAVVHRDYSILGSDIRVKIFDHLLEIISPGPLPDSIRPESLGSGRSEIRNRVLAPIFKDLKLIESWGTGIQKIRKEVSNYPGIQFLCDELHHAFRVQFIKIPEKLNTPPNALASTLSSRQQKLLELFEKGIPISFRQLKQHFPDISDRSLQSDLWNLKQEGFINSEGHGRGAYWIL